MVISERQQLANGVVDEAPSDDGNNEEPPPANQVVASPPNPAASSSTTARQAQLAQLTELEKRLEEERRQTRLLRTTFEQEFITRGARAQVAGRIAREGILADDNVDKPLELQRASQKLVAVAYLL